MKKTIVITGASSGVGRAIALEFAAHQHRLIIAARNTTALFELAKECEELGAEVKVVTTDVTNYSDMLDLASKADDMDGIDVWVNNAGVLAIGKFDKSPMEITTQVIKTNLLGYMHGAHAVLPYFKKQGQGIIINNISIGGFLPVPFGAGYSASKFGLRGFSAALKAELIGYPNIHVCDAFPAFLDTPGIQHAANYTGKQLRPAPPVYDPKRVATAIVKLASHPRGETMIGSTSILLRYAYGLFPRLTQSIAGTVISGYLERADPIAKTDGNLFGEVDYGNAVYGGWGLPGKPKAHRKYIGAGLMLLIAAGLVMSGWKRR
jgi:short-subunit dehydrogenase